ncbi:MAG: isoamylase early set domain-containing protein [Candidatus Rokuibacteriota bacterium]
MFERNDEALERIVHELRQPVRLDPELEGRVMAEITTAPVGGRSLVGAAWHWLVTPRRIAISPLKGLVLAAGLAALLLARPWDRAWPTRARPHDRFQFLLVTRGAASVALVGDFNDWDPTRTPMRGAHQGVWTAVVPLAPGRYRYAFLVNGTQWLADPAAPRAADDEFGAPSSVVTVGGS